jgi:hypothetical protein
MNTFPLSHWMLYTPGVLGPGLSWWGEENWRASSAGDPPSRCCLDSTLMMRLKVVQLRVRTPLKQDRPYVAVGRPSLSDSMEKLMLVWILLRWRRKSYSFFRPWGKSRKFRPRTWISRGLWVAQLSTSSSKSSKTFAITGDGGEPMATPSALAGCWHNVIYAQCSECQSQDIKARAGKRREKLWLSGPVAACGSFLQRPGLSLAIVLLQTFH